MLPQNEDEAAGKKGSKSQRLPPVGIDDVVVVVCQTERSDGVLIDDDNFSKSEHLDEYLGETGR